MPAELILTVAVQGILTGLVYGLMALGLSVIFGVVRVVNFAHGEMMTIASYAAIVAFGAWNIDPLISMIPIAVLLFAMGYAMQAVLINPFINRPEHSQFILLAAVAIIMVNGLLMIFGPDARNVLVDYALDSIEVGPLLIDKVRVITAILALAITTGLFAFFKLSRTGKAIRACADNHMGALVVGLNVKRLYALTFGIGSAIVGAAGDDDPADRHHAQYRAGVYPAGLRHCHYRRSWFDARCAARRRADRPVGSHVGSVLRALGQNHVRRRHSHSGSSIPAPGPAGT